MNHFLQVVLGLKIPSYQIHNEPLFAGCGANDASLCGSLPYRGAWQPRCLPGHSQVSKDTKIKQFDITWM